MSEQNHPDDHVPLDETWADVPADDTIADDAVPLCPNCLAANDPANHFCEQCGAPLTSHAAIDPLGQVYAQGHIYRKMLSGRPMSRFVLAGVWAIFLPALLSGVAVLGLVVWSWNDPHTIRMESPETAWLVVLLVLALAVLYVTILWRATQRYRQDAAARTPSARE